MNPLLMIDFAKGFSCVGKNCPYTCCKGWQILVDDETFEAYQKLEGIRGSLQRAFITKGDIKRIRKPLIVCPFFTKERLCGHQASGRMELMPLVCRNYPRRFVGFGNYTEMTIELSCPEAARLFLENPGRRYFTEAENKWESLWDIENDDEAFLDFLKSEREKILDFVWSDRPIYLIWEDLYAYIREQNDALARDDFERVKRIRLTEHKDLQGDYSIKEGRGYAFFSIPTIDRMLLEHIDRSALLFRVPQFYSLIRKYLKIFSKMKVSHADYFFSDRIKEMMGSDGRLELKYRSYFSYLIQQEYMLSYESYSLVREFLFCVLYTQLLMLFDLVEYIKSKGASPAREHEIVYLAEHNLRHNPYLRKNLYSVIREEFF